MQPLDVTLDLGDRDWEWTTDDWSRVGTFAGVDCVWSQFGDDHLYGVGVHQFSDGTVHIVNSSNSPVEIKSIRIGRREMNAPFVLRPRIGVCVRHGRLDVQFMRSSYGPMRCDLPSRLAPAPNTTEDAPTLGFENGIATPFGDAKGYAHGGGGIETSTGYDVDVAYHRRAEDGHWARMPIWSLDANGRPSRLGGKILYNLNDRRLPWDAPADDGEPVAHWGSHQIRPMRHGDATIYHARDPLSMLRAWMLAEESSWGEWSESQVGPLTPQYHGQWINTSLAQRGTQPRGSGHYGALRELGWVAYGWARWIDILRRGWVELPGGIRAFARGDTTAQEERRVRARGGMLLDYVAHVAREPHGMVQFNWLPTFQAAFGPGYGGQSFEWGIAVVGIDALARSLDRPIPACIVRGCQELYWDLQPIPYEAGKPVVGPPHYINTEGARVVPVTAPGYVPAGDPAHVWNALAVAHERGWDDALKVGLRHWLPHGTLHERLAFCRELTDKSWSARYEAALEGHLS